MTLAIIAANVAVFAIFNVALASVGGMDFAVLAFGHVPTVAHEVAVLPESLRVIPEDLYLLTALTSGFVHADFLHLAGNMLFIWVFGDNVEDALGHFRYLLFYLVCAFCAAWFHAFVFPQSDAALVGASGAAAGIVAAYLMLHPKMKVWVLFLSFLPLELAAGWLLGAWVVFQLFMFLSDTGGEVSWAAHVGGIGAGLALVVLLKRSDVPLFDRQIIPPHAIAARDGDTIRWGQDGA
ncbi:MAG: rhomboid family intramembrane serine protease [Pseudomonadota bacterium]